MSSDWGDAWTVAAALVAAPTLAAQLTLLLEAAPRVGGADSATIYLRDDLSSVPRAIARYGYEMDVFGTPRLSGMTEHVLATGETVVVHDATSDPGVNPVVPAAGIRSVVALPLPMRRMSAAGDAASQSATAASDSSDTPPAGQPQARIMGVLFVNANRPAAFDPKTVGALQGMAALAAVAIENSYLLARQHEAAEQLREALRLREQFASAASHELKSPLTPLKGYAQAIRRRFERAEAGGEPVDPAWLRRALGIMLGQIDRLDGLVSDLLDVSRLRAGTFSLAPEPLDLVVLVEDTLDRFRDSLIDLADRLTPEVEHRIVYHASARTLPGAWDRTRLDQLITNLLNNAVKYSPEGGTVEVRVGRVGVVSRSRPAVREAIRAHAPYARPDWAYLSVRDQGIGLPADPQAQAALFQPFKRGSNAPPDRFSGFGLGLFICAEVARRHGGAIWAESAGPFKGTTIHCVLPPIPPDLPAAGGEAGSPDASPSEPSPAEPRL